MCVIRPQGDHLDSVQLRIENKLLRFYNNGQFPVTITFKLGRNTKYLNLSNNLFTLGTYDGLTVAEFKYIKLYLFLAMVVKSYWTPTCAGGAIFTQNIPQFIWTDTSDCCHANTHVTTLITGRCN